MKKHLRSTFSLQLSEVYVSVITEFEARDVFYGGLYDGVLSTLGKEWDSRYWGLVGGTVYWWFKGADLGNCESVWSDYYFSSAPEGTAVGDIIILGI